MGVQDVTDHDASLRHEALHRNHLMFADHVVRIRRVICAKKINAGGWIKTFKNVAATRQVGIRGDYPVVRTTAFLRKGDDHQHVFDRSCAKQVTKAPSYVPVVCATQPVITGAKEPPR